MSQTNTSNLNQNQNHTRVIDSVLGKLEKRVLLWLAARMPSWVVPDTLTTIGLFAAVLIFLGYALTIYDKAFLWLASFGFLLNWFGDSLDGTLARYRKIERPRYGFFVDHIIDSVDEVFVFLGIGISPYVQFELALLALVAYMLVSIYVYLATYVNGVFRISYGGIGPTETRLLAILANTFVFFVGNPTINLSFITATFYDVFAVVMTLIALTIFTINSIKTASELSREDRAARKAKIREERAARRLEKASRLQAQREERMKRKLLRRPNSRTADTLGE